ncbi:MAG: hypothetical protein WD063_17955 [Pirellulales bacterium]
MAESLRRGLWGNLFIGAGVLVVLTTAAAWYSVPVQYEAYALVKVASTPPSVLAKRQDAAEEFAVFKRTQVQLILSPAVLNGTLREPKINRLSIVQKHEDDPVAWLKGHLIIDYPDDAEIMRITLRGDNRDDLVKIVDKVVDVYLREIVQHDKQLRMENEDELRKAYERQVTVYQKELDALRTLEAIHKTSGSHEAQLKQGLAVQDLEGLCARRREILSRIDDNDLDIMIDRARALAPKEARTADPPAAEKPADGSPQSELEIKRRFLADKLAELNSEIERKTNELAVLESFSAQVAAKQEELNALRAIKNQLVAELDRATVERLAPDRITKVDSASIAASGGDAVRRMAALAACAAAGVALLVVGLVLRLPRRRES